jgi:hypothetical protein
MTRIDNTHAVPIIIATLTGWLMLGAGIIAGPGCGRSPDTEAADDALDSGYSAMFRTMLAAAVALPLFAGAAAADALNNPQSPIYRWNPLVQHNRLNGNVTIYQPLDPAASDTRDYSAPRTVYDADSGTLYQDPPRRRRARLEHTADHPRADAFRLR